MTARSTPGALALNAGGVLVDHSWLRILGGGADEFYADLRWTGWEREIERVGLGEGLAIYPPLCTAESRPIANTSRRPVPWAELVASLEELAKAPEGPIQFHIEP